MRNRLTNGEEFHCRAVNSDSLESRLKINSKYQSKNFDFWLHRKLNVIPGEHILDVGCGTGSQSLKFLEAIGKNGTVSSLDISEDSILKLINLSNNDRRLEVAIADMDDIERVILNVFKQKIFSLAHSSYALYYSSDYLKVLRAMYNSLEDSGRIAVSNPVAPHGMVEIAEQFSKIPKEVKESLDFGPKFLEKAFRSLFYEVNVHFFQSEMQVGSIDDFMTFYQSTTYYDENAEVNILEYAKKQIEKYGEISYEKNSYLIIGMDKRL